MSIETVTEVISPATAAKYLELNECNRPLSHSQRDKIAKDMSIGMFRHTHQGIAFDVRGKLVDGQHRLSAIVKSGTTQTMQVTRGVPIECRSMVDVQARSRTIADSLAMENFPVATKEAVAVARLWSALLGKNSLSASEVKSFICDHLESIAHAIKASRSNPTLKHAAVLTMIAIAHERGLSADISQWCDVVITGMAAEPWQASAIKFRDWWMTNNRHGGTTQRIDLCKRVYASMLAWTQKRPLTKLYVRDQVDWLQ